MDEHGLDLLPGLILQWVREDGRRKVPRLWVRASKEYLEEPEALPPRAREEDINLVTAIGILEVSPQYGNGGWALQVRVQGSVELRPTGQEPDEEDEDELSPDDFEAEFLIPERGEVEVGVATEDKAGWQRFQR